MSPSRPVPSGITELEHQSFRLARRQHLVKGGGVFQKAEAGTTLDDNLGGLAVMRQYPAFRLEAGREDHRQRFRMMRARHRDMRAGFAIRRSDIEEHVKGA